MTVRLRPAVAADLAAAFDLTRRLADFDLPPGRTADEIALADNHLLQQQIDAPSDDSFFHVAERDGTVVGVVFANTRADYFTRRSVAYVEVLAVSREAAGQGIARKLLEAVEDWAAARRLERVDLTVFAVNQRARGFYEHLGYRGEFVRYVKEIPAAGE